MRTSRGSAGDEGLGRILRRDDAVGLDVVGAHAARDVHRQHDGALRQRQRDHRQRPRDGQQQRARASSNSAGGTWRRQPGPLPSASLTSARLAKRTVLLRRLRSSHRYSQHQRRQQQQRPEHVGPEEVHARAPAACCGASLRRWPESARRRGAPRCRRRSAKRSSASSRSSSVDEFQRVDAGCGQGARAARPRALRRRPRSARGRPGRRVDEQLLAGLGVLHRHQAEVGQRHLQRVEQAHRQHLVALRQLRQRVVPAGRADEVGHHEHQRAALDGAGRGVQQVGQRGAAAARVVPRPLAHRAQQVQHCGATAAAAARVSTLVAVEQRADAVAVAREQAREHGDEVDRHRQLGASAGAEVDAARQVEQEPGGQSRGLR